MSKQEQRIAIAEACGWKWVNHPDFHNTPGWGWEAPGHYHGFDDYKSEKELKAHSQLPDYLNDLNAMHEAEKVLDGMCQLNYLGKLHENNHYCSWGGTCATASQRAEAFLKTLNLWKP